MVTVTKIFQNLYKQITVAGVICWALHLSKVLLFQVSDSLSYLKLIGQFQVRRWLDTFYTPDKKTKNQLLSTLHADNRNHETINFIPIDLFHNGGQIKYSFVLMVISPISLSTTSKFQKNVCFKTRAVGLINIKTKECKSGRHLWKWSIDCYNKLYREVQGNVLENGCTP